jgi:hypothetical protein
MATNGESERTIGRRQGEAFTVRGGHARRSFAVRSALLSCLLLSLTALPAFAQHHGAPGGEPRGGFGRPGEGFGPGSDRGGYRPVGPGFHGRGGEHLPQWFAQHGSQSPQQQEEALRREPGFSRLPPGQQQQLINRLHRLDMQPPALRQRILERNEMFMALPPQQQSSIRRSSQLLRQLPADRQRAFREAFRNLREMPPNEREQALDSARFQAEYSPEERDIMRNLLTIEPYPGAPPPPR